MATVSSPEVAPTRSKAHDPIDYCGHILRQARQQQGLSLTALAARSGVSKTLIGEIETGKWGPSFHAVLQVAAALGIPFRDLLPPEDSVLAQILAQIHARGETYAAAQLTLLTLPSTCLRRRRRA